MLRGSIPLRADVLLRAVLAVVVLGTAGGYAAAPLAALAPSSTVLAVHVGGHDTSYPALRRDLAGLDVATARQTLVAGLTYVRDTLGGPQPGDGRASAAIGAVLDLLQGKGRPSTLAPHCPALANLSPDLQEGLLAISATARVPLPAALLLLRFAPGSTDTPGAVLDALHTCFGHGSALEQDGVALLPLSFEGTEVTAARLGDVLAVSTSADLVRTTVRLAHGSSEPNLTTAGAGSSPALTGPGLGVTFDGAAVADLLGAVPGVAADPTARTALTRLQAALRTVPWSAWRVQDTADGQVQESWVHVDAEGGDPTLARLIRCDGCHARPSLLVPASALGVEASNLRLSAWADYLAGLVRDVTAAGGQPLDPLVLLRQRTGIDLSADLFPWLGNVVTSVELPAPTGTPQALLGLPAQVTIVPVASAGQARAGLNRIGAALGVLLDTLPAERAGGVPPRALVAVRSESYRDVGFTRIQIGPSVDVGVALVGNWLVLASPSAALRSIVDTYRGGPTVHAGPLAAALAAAPSDASAVRADDPAADLHGAAALLRSVAQPLAFALQGALAEARHSAHPAPTAAPAAAAPGLAELLAVTELPADALDVVAGHLGTRRGWVVWQGDLRVGHTLLPIH